MSPIRIACFISLLFVSALPARAISRADRGMPLVDVSHIGDNWIIKGQKQTVTVNAKDFSINVQAGPASWQMVPSGASDMIVRAGGKDFNVSLADVHHCEVTPWDTGFRVGIKMTLSGWHDVDAAALKLYLTIGLEDPDNDLVCDVAAVEDGAAVRQLDWPTALDGHDVDCTLLSNHRGVMLPRDWPHAYFPAQSTNPDGSLKASDTSVVQSNMVESWSMSWWGFQKGSSAMMCIVETPNDAAYQFGHPAGGPTVIGPRWRECLGKLAYPRTARFCFIPTGNYVDMAKRYRQYAIERGYFVSLKDKIAKCADVAQIIGTPVTGFHALTNIKSDSLHYSTTQPEKNYHLDTFDDIADRIHKLKSLGIDHVMVKLAGWPNQGYDRQHPDELPPAPVAGGWQGMKKVQDACEAEGFLFTLHDQYRDYYIDAPSYNTEFAVHDQDDSNPSTEFPGSRFGQWKEGDIPFMNNWEGGTQAYLNNRFMLGNMQRTYNTLAAHGIHPQGTHIDVFGYVPPDEDFNPEHPTTRTDAIKARADCFLWGRAHLGVIGTEAGCDWTVPYVDQVTPLKSAKGIPVPLYNLVYHDAIVVTYDFDDLRGFLNGGAPQFYSGGGQRAKGLTKEDFAQVHRMAALHKRVGLLEMTKHEFLDDHYKIERTTFADGTSVTVDWDKKSVEISPDVQ